MKTEKEREKIRTILPYDLLLFILSLSFLKWVDEKNIGVILFAEWATSHGF